MDTGVFLYKCRACTEVFKDGTTSNFDRMQANFIYLLSSGKGLDSQCPGMIESHHGCFGDKNRTGVADLIALKKITQQ